MNAKRILSVALLAGFSSVASAQTSNQTVTFQVNAINQIAFTGSPSLQITTAAAGSNPTDATASASWAVTTNQTNAKVTASINSDMPTGLTLKVNLGAPAGATSAGDQSLSSTAVDLVTSITKLAEGSLSAGYTLSALPTAGVVASTTRTVTYTITGGT
jgi:hypothetical protein